MGSLEPIKLSPKLKTKLAEKKKELEASGLKYDPLMKLKVLNESIGDLPGYDCKICRNKGVIYTLTKETGEITAYNCKCINIRNSIERLKKSGLSRLVSSCRFDNFSATRNYQKVLLETAQLYITKKAVGYLVCGQSGSGKTHICSALLCKFISEQAVSGVYMTWREESVKLKAYANDPQYLTLIDPFKRADVLYIDDLFKTEPGKRPTQADINLAFEIINYRYNNRKRTIISTELFVDDLLDIDQATTSRIIQMSRGFIIEIAKDATKNYRLKDKYKPLEK